MDKIEVIDQTEMLDIIPVKKRKKKNKTIKQQKNTNNNLVECKNILLEEECKIRSDCLFTKTKKCKKTSQLKNKEIEPEIKLDIKSEISVLKSLSSISQENDKSLEKNIVADKSVCKELEKLRNVLQIALKIILVC